MTFLNPVLISETNELMKTLFTLTTGKKILLVTGNSFRKSRHYQDVKGLNIVQEISNVKSHPELDDIVGAYEGIEHDKVQMILAIGGGSVLDSAKVLSLINVDDISACIKNGKIDQDISAVPMILVPSTAGTGSEVTKWATVWNSRVGEKYSIEGDKLYAEHAVYFPELTLGLPREFTINAALDSLSHALESIWNKNTNAVSQNYAIQAVGLIVEYLPLLSKNLERLDYRAKIMKASHYAGLAFSNTKTSIAHALSYFITMKSKTPHGVACSFSLPCIYEIAVGKGLIPSRLIEILGHDRKVLKDLISGMGISTSIKSYLKQSDLEAFLEIASKNERMQNSLVSLREVVNLWESM
jgi:phosphonate metabolism-associated iron-containing alcohol dehydrogenase